jgi:hypothetical protein
VLRNLDPVPSGSASPWPVERRSRLLRRRALAAAVALSLALPGSRAAAQSDEEKAAARAMAIQGGEALAARQYADAFDLVSRAEQLVHAPTHMLMIARAQVGLGRLVAAKETYLRLLREELAATAPAAFKRAQAEARDDLSALDPRIAQLRIALEGVGQKKVTVKMDDQPVSPVLVGVFRPVDPGKHEVVATPAGQGPVRGSIELKEGERKEIKLAIPDAPLTAAPPPGPLGPPDLSPPPPPPSDQTESPGFFTPLRGVGVGFGAAGLVGVVVGSFFVAKGFEFSGEADKKSKACVLGGCLPFQKQQILDLDAQAANAKNIGIAAFVVGGAALVGGVTLIVIGKPTPRRAGAYVAPWFSGNAGGILGAF